MIPDRLPLARRLRRVFWPVSIDREVADELAAHLELQTRRYMEDGMRETEARAAARHRFGDVERVRGECAHIRHDMEADMQRVEFREDVRSDIEFAVRTLRRSPLFTAVAVATLAIAIGANTAIFSVIRAVLLRQLPYSHADRVALVWNGNGDAPENRTAVAVPEYFDLREQLRAHDAVAATTNQSMALVADGGEPEQVLSYVVTPNLFDVLGAAPLAGRGFGGDDGAPQANRVVLLSHALWTRRFGADPALIGRSISVGGVPRTVIGIMPADVRFPDAPLDFLREPADLWIPSTLEGSRNGSRGDQNLAVVVRRKIGVTDAQARADIDAVAARWRTSYPNRYASESARHWKLVAIGLQEQMVGSARAALLIIGAAVGLVLLIACVNVANLLLARGATRQRELAIRLALGAGRGRLVRQLMTESVVLGAAGGLLGLLLAWSGIRLLVQLDGGHLPRLAGTSIDPAVLAFSLGVSVIAGLLVGIAPALQQSTQDLRGALSESSRGGGEARGRQRLRLTLVVAQMAMALVILAGAGLLVRSFAALQQVDPGFASDNSIVMQVNLPRARYDSAAKVTGFYAQLVRQLSSTPGVAEASAVYPVPMGTDGWSGSFTVEGEPDGPDHPMPHAEYAVAMPGLFHTMRIPLIAGREFDASDTRESPRVVIVDERLARQHWPNQQAIGKRIGGNGPKGTWATVVGVVGHVHRAGPQSEGEPQIYLPHAQSPQTMLAVVVRTKAPAAPMLQTVRAAVRTLDRNLPVAGLDLLASMRSRAVARERFNTLLLGVFALTALLLASVGLYGVMAYVVAQRTREIGIRMALGGEPAAIRRMVLGEGLVISLLGLVIGLGLSLAAARAMKGLLFGVTPTDGWTYGVVALVLLMVGAAASYGPARRATLVDPLTALRE